MFDLLYNIVTFMLSKHRVKAIVRVFFVVSEEHLSARSEMMERNGHYLSAQAVSVNGWAMGSSSMGVVGIRGVECFSLA
jgi:hypothetical protein